MKTIITVLLLGFSVSFAAATDIYKIGFRAYSSPAIKECGAFGMAAGLKKDGGIDKTPIQGFSPDPTYSRTFNIGTKGFANYSTVYPGNVKLTAMQFTCRLIGTDSTQSVKVFLNDIETHFLTLSVGEIIVGK